MRWWSRIASDATEAGLLKELGRAIGESNQGKYISALRRFKRLERSSPHPGDIAKLRFFEATCFTSLGRTEEAENTLASIDVSCLDMITRADYEFEWARLERAQGKRCQALQRVQAVRRLAGTAGEQNDIRLVLMNLAALEGILLAELNDCDSAIPMLEAVPREDRGWYEVQLHLGDCRYKKGEFNNALHCYLCIASAEQAPKPLRVSAVRNIGFMFYETGDYRNAIKYLKQIRHEFDGVPSMRQEVRRLLSSAYSRLKSGNTL